MKIIYKEVYKVIYHSLEYSGESDNEMYVIATSVKEAIENADKLLPTFMKEEGMSKDGDWTPISAEFICEVCSEK